MLLILIMLLLLGGVTLLVMALLPKSVEGVQKYQKKKSREIDKKLDTIFYSISRQQMLKLYCFSPFILGLPVFYMTKSPIFGAIAAAIGFLFIPNYILKMKEEKRRQKFELQILDSVNILSSSLKGGLSLMQAIENLIEEIPPAISQEFGLVLRENKMGLTLEKGLENLAKRMDMEDLDLVINSVLVAKETGGDLTKVLSRLSTTIRDSRKLKDNIKTLTLQGRLQGYIMTALPFLFIMFIVSTNPTHFDIMLETDFGRMLILVAIVLQAVGMFLIKKFSIIKL